jgi:hypothetical protein
MISINPHRVIICLCLFVLLAVGAPAVLGQDSGQTDRPAALKNDDVNLDLELYLIVASNERAGGTEIPAVLERVNKQLHSTLPFKNYSLVATLIGRVKNEGHLELTWLGGSLLAPHAALEYTPTFSQFTIGQVKYVDSDGGPMVRMLHFNYGARFPIQTGTNIPASGTNSAPIFQYERTGLSTDISVRPDEPGIVGSLNVGPSGDALVIVVSAKRAANR